MRRTSATNVQMSGSKGYTVGQSQRKRWPDSSPPGLWYLRGSEVTLQKAGHKHDDLVAQGLRTIPCSDL